jgi:signal peptidase II
VRKNVLIVGVIVTLILLFDQIIKVYVKTHFEPSFGANSGHPILGNWFVMEYIENQGMAFGTTFGHSIWHKYIPDNCHHSYLLLLVQTGKGWSS